jgi:hypothetical protein
MIIDWHAHIYTPEEAADDRRTYDGQSGPSWGERGCPMVLENFLEAHHQAGIDLSVVTNAAHYLRGKAASEELPAVQRWSDYAAQLPIRVSRFSSFPFDKRSLVVSDHRMQAWLL